MATNLKKKAPAPQIVPPTFRNWSGVMEEFRINVSTPQSGVKLPSGPNALFDNIIARAVPLDGYFEHALIPTAVLAKMLGREGMFDVITETLSKRYPQWNKITKADVLPEAGVLGLLMDRNAERAKRYLRFGPPDENERYWPRGVLAGMVGLPKTLDLVYERISGDRKYAHRRPEQVGILAHLREDRSLSVKKRIEVEYRLKQSGQWLMHGTNKPSITRSAWAGIFLAMEAGIDIRRL